jgi:hypothetical protein
VQGREESHPSVQSPVPSVILNGAKFARKDLSEKFKSSPAFETRSQLADFRVLENSRANVLSGGFKHGIAEILARDVEVSEKVLVGARRDTRWRKSWGDSPTAAHR